MNPESSKIQRIYLTLHASNTLAASFIWGINTLFLLDAGLSNAQAFAANAFFTVGMLLFEVPTGVVADLKGRRLSYLLGAGTLMFSTLLYLYMWQTSAPFWGWALASILLGLGFTFFSGAVEAWLVDALNFSGFKGKLESVFAKGKIVEGVAMLGGSVAGGIIAQATNLGVPYILRAAVLGLTFLLAYILMKDEGFEPEKGASPTKEVKQILDNSINFGLKAPAVRWLMLSAPFASGVAFYGFYAFQPYLLELYGDPNAYSIAGLAAAVMAGAQIAGGLVAPHSGKVFSRRTGVLLAGTILSTLVLALIGILTSFWAVVGLMIVWGLAAAALMPVRQTYINALIPSKQRATVLSFDSLLGSAGGAASQPLLGKSADVWGYPASYVIGAGIHALAIPFVWLASRVNRPEDVIRQDDATKLNKLK